MAEFVKQGNKVYQVIAREGVHLWLKAEGMPPFTGISVAYVPYTPFFQEGKTYRHGPTKNTFEVEVVRGEHDGRQVAFGRHTEAGTGTVTWRVRDASDYQTGYWTEGA